MAVQSIRKALSAQKMAMIVSDGKIPLNSSGARIWKQTTRFYVDLRFANLPLLFQ